MDEKIHTHDQWVETQKQFWDQLRELQGKLAEPHEGADDPWQKLDHWWRSAATDTAGPTNQYMEKMILQGKAYFQLAEACVLSSDQGDGDSVGTFFDALRERLDQAKNSQEPLSELMAFCELPFDAWLRAGALLAPFTDLFRGDLFRDGLEGMQRKLSMPDLAITADERQQYEKLLRCLVTYQSALTSYNDFFSDLAISCTTDMEQRLEQIKQQGESISSAKALHLVWSEVCESRYSNRVMEPEYAQLQGKLLNSTMAVKQQMSIVVDAKLTQLQMPTSGEIKSLQQQASQNRQEIKMLKSEIAELKTALGKGAGI